MTCLTMNAPRRASSAKVGRSRAATIALLDVDVIVNDVGDRTIHVVARDVDFMRLVLASTSVDRCKRGEFKLGHPRDSSGDGADQPAPRVQSRPCAACLLDLPAKRWRAEARVRRGQWCTPPYAHWRQVAPRAR